MHGHMKIQWPMGSLTAIAITSRFLTFGGGNGTGETSTSQVTEDHYHYAVFHYQDAASWLKGKHSLSIWWRVFGNAKQQWLWQTTNLQLRQQHRRVH